MYVYFVFQSRSELNTYYINQIGKLDSKTMSKLRF